MKKKLFLAVVAPLAALFWSGPAAAGEPPLAGWFAEGFVAEERSLPDTPFTLVEEGVEREVRLSDYAGRVLVVNFWATWCAPCVREMPELDNLQAELGGADFEVLVVSNDRGGLRQVEPFYAEHGLERLGIWLDPRSELARALELRGLPTTFVIDRSGTIRGRAEGAAPWDGPEALALLRWYLEEEG